MSQAGAVKVDVFGGRAILSAFPDLMPISTDPNIHRSRPSLRKAPLRVVHVVDSLDPGGMENGIANVASYLGARGYDFHAICLTRCGKFAERMPSPSQVVSLSKVPGVSLHCVAALRTELERVGADVIHTHNFGPLIYVGLASLVGGLPPILHGEHAELDSSERSWQRLALRRWLYSRCRIVHTVSESLTRDLLECGLRHPRLAAIPNGVDTQRFQPVSSRASIARDLGLPVPEDGFVIGMVGRFGPYKRQQLLVDAFDLVASSHPAAWLILVGDGGPQASVVRDRVTESPYRDRILLAGFQSEPAPWYQAFDLMVLPSINEGMSNAVLEAMATGTPVLAHSSCGCAEVIEDGETGFLADFRDPASLAEKLRFFLSAPDGPWRASGAEARRQVESRFSLTAMAEGYKRLYEECLLPGAGPSQ
jgi:glycosyltransferase involved in cell wall biosynthesis